MNTLEMADKTINSERQDQYGSPEDSFQIISEFWSSYIGIPIKPVDVANMMALLKIARALGQRPHKDNYIDACGYLAIASDRLTTWPKEE